jgi:putative ABC transport system permease protein
MTELFGIPVGTLLAILGATLVVVAGALAVLALRSPVLVRLGVRNVGRRRARSALIVVGLMLGTAIIAAALATGDTMNHTIRSTATEVLGPTDEVVSARGAAEDIPGELGAATGTGYFSQSVATRIDRATAGTGLVDGVTGAIIEQVAVQAPQSRQSEPSVIVFAPDPRRMEGFAPIRAADGRAATLGDLRPGEIFLNARAGEELNVTPGQRVNIYAGPEPASFLVRDLVSFDGTGTADSAALLPLSAAQRLFGRAGQIKHVLVSNRGGTTSGAVLSTRITAMLTPVVAPFGLEVATVKQDAIDAADEAGTAFMAFFTTFGTFSIAAGILLIFLIFVMLAAERRAELGIARAVGTRRGHLVEMFVFEGAAYDLIAALVGAVLGAGVAYGMVILMARAFGAEDRDAGLQIEYSVTSRSLLIAFALGVLLTLAVVAFSAWRVSRMTIATAIRNLPEPGTRHRRRRLVAALAVLLLGVVLAVAGATGGQATPLMLGVSLVIVASVPLMRVAGVGERAAYTGGGLALVVSLMLPWSVWEGVFGPLAMDFSTWIAAGLMIVIGAVWTIVYNADVLLPAATRILGRVGRLAPILKISMANPLAARFRTGTTLAMFTLVVFTLVTGTITSGSFTSAFNNEDAFGGGFDVRGSTGSEAPIADMSAAIRTAPGLRPSDFTAVGSQSVLAVDAVQLGTSRGPETYVARGLDPSFLDHTTFGLGAIARGYSSARQVWDAVRDHPGLAVVDSFIVPRRDNFGFAVGLPDFRLTGFVYDDRVFDPILVDITDPQTGRSRKVTVIGVLADTAPIEMIGLSTSEGTLTDAFPGRAVPTIHYFGLAPGVDPDRTAHELESAFLANGLEAQSIRQVVHDAVAANRTFNRLIQGFMGLGLIVGVAALGVISARSVVERRQQIGMLRAIGFRRSMVRDAFLLESSLVAITAIVVGTGLGVLLAKNIIDDSRSQPSWENLEMVVPWRNLTVIFLTVYAVALVATLAPARRAARIEPAEALRYQ